MGSASMVSAVTQLVLGALGVGESITVE